jgi:hypothetical protein
MAYLGCLCLAWMRYGILHQSHKGISATGASHAEEGGRGIIHGQLGAEKGKGQKARTIDD